MPKLRKMLGAADWPSVTRMMQLIETQNKRTLAGWAADFAGRYLPLTAAEARPALTAALDGCRRFAGGALPVKDLRPLVREAAAAARAKASPVEEAAARAVSVAAGVPQTPTNALGFLFYGAAAAAYSASDEPADWDALAEAEFTAAYEALAALAVSDEPAFEMAAGLLRGGNCELAIATTGLAGPRADGTNKPVGLCFLAAGTNERVRVFRFQLTVER